MRRIASPVELLADRGLVSDVCLSVNPFIPMKTSSSTVKVAAFVLFASACAPAFALPPRFYGPRVGPRIVVPIRPIVPVPVPARPAPASPYRTAVAVQRALAGRGYYGGPIDGDIGPGSRAAIRAYQADHGMEVTGEIDGPLLRSLGI